MKPRQACRAADRQSRGGWWARRVIAAYRDAQADRLVGEVNHDGELVLPTGKRTRAEPVPALYEQGRVHHVGAFPTLEDQLCLWDAQSGEISPDRLDALVWALTELIVDAPKAVDISYWG
jgi:phage terminase large subunit-like protein